jgi:hypothetical protein
MSEATVPQPDADNDWDTIDEAVRGQLGQFLTSGTDLFNGRNLMGRLDPLAVLAGAAYQPVCCVAPRQDRRCRVPRRRRNDSRDSSCNCAGAGGTPSYAPKRARQTLLRSGLE